MNDIIRIFVQLENSNYIQYDAVKNNQCIGLYKTITLKAVSDMRNAIRFPLSLSTGPDEC